MSAEWKPAGEALGRQVGAAARKDEDIARGLRAAGWVLVQRKAAQEAGEPVRTTFAVLLERMRATALEAAFLSVMVDTGLRVGEALGLYRRHSWEGRDYESHVLLEANPPVVRVEQQRAPNAVVASPLKARESITLTLSPRTVEWLKAAEVEQRRRGILSERFHFPFTSVDLYGPGGLVRRLRENGKYPDDVASHIFLRHAIRGPRRTRRS